MAVNDLTTVMIVLKGLMLCFLFSTAASKNAEYSIASSNRFALSSDARLSLNFAEHAHSRYRRQSEESSGVNADTATNTGSDGQALPDATTQPVKNGSTSNTSTLTPKPSTTAPPTTTTQRPQSTQSSSDSESESEAFEDANVIHDLHDYYTSDVVRNKFDSYWIELENAPKHDTLSNGHRVAAVIPLKFPFHFYGHQINNITVATGGFIYMSPFLHQWLTATQYIAPLMANFDPSLSGESNIYYESEDDRFIVEWKNVILKDQNDTGKFHFQTILRSDDTIQFVYKEVPIPVSQISAEEHPVKVGLSDAYYNDTYVPEYNIKRRTIYEYHKVAIPPSSVASGMVIILNPLPTCNRLTDCDSCVKHEGVKFDCRWCNTIARCSDGLDWYRQHWDKEGCKESSVDSSDQCTASHQNTSTTLTPTTSNLHERTTTLKPQNTPSTTSQATTSTTTIPSVSPHAITTTPTPTIVSGKITEQPSETGGSTSSVDSAQAKEAGCGLTNESDVCSSLPPPVRPITDPLKPSPPNDCNHTNDRDACSSLPPPTKPITDPLQPSSIKDSCPNGKCNSKSDFPVAVVVVIVLIVGLLVALGGWVFYAYTHPHSKSGMWLMEHRPSQIKAKIKFWKSNSDAGTKYKVESEA